MHLNVNESYIICHVFLSLHKFIANITKQTSYKKLGRKLKHSLVLLILTHCFPLLHKVYFAVYDREQCPGAKNYLYFANLD